MFVLGLDLIGNTLIVLSSLGGLLVILLPQSIQVLLVSHFLFFLRYFESSIVLLQLPLFNSVIVFYVLESDLGFLFEFCELI